MKIVYCINSISHVGGIERVTVAKANALAAIGGNEVWIAYTDVNADKPEPSLPVDPRVRLLDLGIRYYADDQRGLYWRLREDTLLRRRHRRALEAELQRIEPDVVIATGQCEKYFLPKMRLRKRPLYVREVHFAADYRLQHASGFIGRTLARLYNFYDYRLRMPAYDAVCVLTRDDYDHNWSRLPIAGKVHVMPNPLTFIPTRRSDLTQKVVANVGRLSHPKNHASLLRAWQKVASRHPDWHLNIYGDGNLRPDLEAQIARDGLTESVRLAGSVSNVGERLSEASIFAFSSRFEGLPLALIEAQAVGLPVVSYDCHYGPSEVVDDGRSGIIVPQADEDALADGICRLIEDEDLRRRMGAAAINTATRYSPAAIADRWMKLFKSLI